MSIDDLWKEISILEKNRRYELVEEKCSTLLKSELDIEFRNQVLRLRSSNYIFLSDYFSAYLDRLTILDSGKPQVGDYFFAALYAINLRKEGEAISLIDKGLSASEGIKVMYYLDSFVFLKSFCFVKIGDYEAASSVLTDVADGFKLWITRPEKPYSKEELLEIISSNA